MILEKALKLYINFLWKKWSSEKTQKKYYNQIRKIFEFNKKLWENRKEITIKEIDKYMKKQKRTHNTKCTEISQIKGFIKYWNINNQIELDSRRIFLPKRERKEARFFEKNEVQKIMKKIQEENIRLKTWIMLILTTWTRISEACSLTKKQLETAIEINDNFQLSVIWKWRKKRSIFLPKKIFELCQKSSKLHEEKTILWRDSQKFSREIRKFRNKVNIKKFSAHTFRHSFITNLAQNWVELYKIQKLAGHSNINTTATYLHACDQELANAANHLEYKTFF